MKRLKLTAFAVALTVLLAGFPFAASEADAASAEEVQYFLNTVGAMVTLDMRDNKILASFSMAQAIFESGWGTSELARNANALFGIRAYQTTWSGKIYDKNQGVLYQNWNELISAKGNWYVSNYTLSFWRAYDNWQDSVNDHSNLFNTSARYENLRENYSYTSCAYLVVEDGYCTDSGYSQNLIRLVTQYNLSQYDYNFNDATSLSLDVSELYMGIGDSYTLEESFQPASATLYREVISGSSVRLTGSVISAVSEGVSRVRFSSGSLAAYCDVTVKAGYGAIVADGAYISCTSPYSGIKIPAEATSIASGAFAGKSGVSQIVIGGNVVSIETGAFFEVSGAKICAVNCPAASVFARDNSMRCQSYELSPAFSDSERFLRGVGTLTVVSALELCLESDRGEVVTVYDADGNSLSEPFQAIICTGYVVRLAGVDYRAVISGDLSGDGILTSTDYIVLKRHFKASSTLSGAYLAAGDLDDNGLIATNDYIHLKNRLK